MSDNNTPEKKSSPAKDKSTQAILELKEGLVALQQQNEARMSVQEDKLAELYKGLESTFNKIHQDTGKRSVQSDSSFDQLSSTIIRTSEEMRKEYEEMERLQDKRITAESQQYSHSITHMI